MANDPNDPHGDEEIRKYAHDSANKPAFPVGDEKSEREYRESMQEAAPYLTLGMQMAVSIVAFVGIGYLIDKSAGTSPQWQGIMAAAGSVLSLTYFLITVIRLSNKKETKKG
jgi:F0F1-type ATP synthase assembly protein I